MIEVEITLDSFGLGVRRRSLGTLEIANDGTDRRKSRGNYIVTARGAHGRVIRRGTVENWPRQSRPVFELVKAALESVGYK